MPRPGCEYFLQSEEADSTVMESPPMIRDYVSPTIKILHRKKLKYKLFSLWNNDAIIPSLFHNENPIVL